MKLEKISKLGNVAKIVALCLPPVVMSLIGLAALSRKKGGKRPAPVPGAIRRSGTG